MKKTLVTFALLCFYAPVAVIACSSSSSSGGSGGSVTSIDSSKQAGTLSDAEKTQYCKDTQAYFAASLHPHAATLFAGSCRQRDGSSDRPG